MGFDNSGEPDLGRVEMLKIRSLLAREGAAI